MNVDKNYQSVQEVPEDTDVKEVTSVEVAREKANSGDIESGMENPTEEKGSCKQRLIYWLPVIVISIALIIIIIIIVAIYYRYIRPFDGGNDVSYTTHGYRFPNTDFDDCCANRKNRHTYLKACNNILKKHHIECIDVIRGSAIVITKSTNTNHKNIICNEFAKIQNLNKHSTADGYHMSEKEVNEHKAKIAKEKDEIIAKLKKEKDKIIRENKNNILRLEEENENNILQLKEESNKTIREKESSILQLKEENENSIQVLRDENNKIIRGLEEENDKTIAELNEKNNKIISENENSILQLTKALDSETREHKNIKNEWHSGLISGRNDQLASKNIILHLQEENKKIIEEKDAIIRQNKNSILKLKEELKEAIKNNKTTAVLEERMKEKNDLIDGLLREDYNFVTKEKVASEKRNTELTHELKVLKSKNDKIIQVLEDEKNELICQNDKIIQENDKTIAELNEKNNKIISELKEKNDKIIQDLTGKYNFVTKQKVVSEKLNTKLKEDLNELKSKQDKIIYEQDKIIYDQDELIDDLNEVLDDNEKDKINRVLEDELNEKNNKIISEKDKINRVLEDEKENSILQLKEDKNELIRHNNPLNKLDGTFPTKLDSSKRKLKEQQLKYKNNQYTIKQQNEDIKQLKTQMQELQLKYDKNLEKIMSDTTTVKAFGREHKFPKDVLDKNNEYLPKENASLLVDNKDLLTKENDKLPAQMKPLKTELYALESNNKDRTKVNAMLLVQIQKLKKQLKILESNNLHSHDESNPFIRTKYSKYQWLE